MITKDIDDLSIDECVELIDKLTRRLKTIAYSHGYKDGFNDGRQSEFERVTLLSNIKNKKED